MAAPERTATAGSGDAGGRGGVADRRALPPSSGGGDPKPPPPARPHRRHRRHWDDPEVVSAVAGSLAGAATAVFVCPLDVLKTRLQVTAAEAAAASSPAPSSSPPAAAKTRRPRPPRPGIASSLRSIFASEGVAGLYRGLTPTLAALLPNWAVYFTTYDRLKSRIGDAAAERGWVRAPDSPPARPAEQSGTDSDDDGVEAARRAARHHPAVHCAAACGAGGATLLVTNPLWVVKTRLQTQHLDLAINSGSGRKNGGKNGKDRVLYRGTADALRRIATEEGARGLWAGALPSLVGVAHVAVQFPLYEKFKSLLADARREGRRGGASDAADDGGADALPASALVVASAASKAVASSLTYPHEVVRSHMHVEGSGSPSAMAATCRRLWRDGGGVRAFYRGCGTNLVRTTPAAALTFTSFELIARQLRAAGARQRERERAEDEREVRRVDGEEREGGGETLRATS